MNGMALRVYCLAGAAALAGGALAWAGCFYPAYEVVDTLDAGGAGDAGDPGDAGGPEDGGGGCAQVGDVVPIACGQAEPTSIVVDATTIYWANQGNGEIMAMLKNLDPPAPFITGETGVCGLAIAGEHIYWRTSAGNLKRKNRIKIDQNVETLASDLGQSCLIAADSTGVYYFRYDVPTSVWVLVRRLLSVTDMTTDIGTSKQPTALAVSADSSLVWTDAMEKKVYFIYQGMGSLQDFGVGSPCGVAVSGKRAYVTSKAEQTVFAINMEDSSLSFPVIEQPSPCALAIPTTGQALYWLSTEKGTVTRLPLATKMPDILRTGPVPPQSIVVDLSHVYWTSGGDDGKVMRAPK